VFLATNSAVFDLNGKSETINRLTGYGTVVSTNAAATLGVLADGSSDTWVRDWFTGDIVVNKLGAGTLTVAADNVFATNTTVSAGTLRFVSSVGYPSTEQPEKVVNGVTNIGTTARDKWLDFRAATNNSAAVRDRVWIRIDFPAAQRVTSYNWVTGDDAQERDPSAWRLQGSYNGADWADLDARTNVVPPTARYTWYNGGTAFPLIGRSVADGPSDDHRYRHEPRCIQELDGLRGRCSSRRLLARVRRCHRTLQPDSQGLPDSDSIGVVGTADDCGAQRATSSVRSRIFKLTCKQVGKSATLKINLPVEGGGVCGLLRGSWPVQSFPLWRCRRHLRESWHRATRSNFPPGRRGPGHPGFMNAAARRDPTKRCSSSEPT